MPKIVISDTDFILRVKMMYESVKEDVLRGNSGKILEVKMK